MNTEGKLKDGFTLVELIVVVAIIAILAAVTVPSYVKYVDNARFSNDIASAESMTRILENHFLDQDAEGYDSIDIKNIIDNFNGSPYDYTPTSSNTGFFFLPSSKRVVALKYEEAESFVDNTALFNQTRLLRNSDLDSEQGTPEELFGTGKKLMTREGSSVAMAVSLIYDLAKSGSLHESVYNDMYSKIDSYADGMVARFAGLAISTELKNKILEFLDEFNPESTLFVNDTSWTTSATDGNDVNRIVFAEGLNNIPAIDAGLDNLDLGDVTIPRTVRTIEAGAFSEGTVSRLIMKNDAGISVIGEVEDGSLLSNIGKTANLNEIGAGLDLVQYENDNPYNIDLSELVDYLTNEEKVTLTGYRIDIDITYKSYSRIHVYTTEGYYGYVIATPKYPNYSSD